MQGKMSDMPKTIRAAPKRVAAKVETGFAQKPAQACLDLNVFLPFQLSVLSNTVSRQIAALYDREFGLSVWQWRVMAVAAETPGMDATEIGRRTAMDKVAVSRAIAGLIARGLLQRAPSRTDRRRTELSLTAAGKHIYARIVPMALAEEARLISALSGTEQAELARLLGQLAEAATGGAPLWQDQTAPRRLADSERETSASSSRVKRSTRRAMKAES